jgi:hypothetical protein
MKPGTVLFMATIGACTHAPSSSTDRYSPGDYYPLAVGNSWTYQVNTLGQTTDQTVTVVGKEGEFFSDSTHRHLMVDASGLRDDERYLLQRPLVKGNHWKSVISVTSVESYEIVETDKKVSTAAGDFGGCIVVRSTNPQNKSIELVNEMTFAPGVGIVRIQTQMVKDGKATPQVTLELTNYKVANAPISSGSGPT